MLSIYPSSLYKNDVVCGNIKCLNEINVFKVKFKIKKLEVKVKKLLIIFLTNKHVCPKKRVFIEKLGKMY
jgi:hypothetical protein